MIKATLSPHGDFAYSLYSALDMTLPASPDECDGYIITGSVHDAYADEPWIHNLASWIRQLDEIKKPLVGICFGHQIISIALGGTVEKSSRGWGIGMSYNQIEATPEWMTPKQKNLNLLVSHQDQVVQLPAEVNLLAASDFCPYFMFAKDAHILTVQGHPEFSPEFVQRLIEARHTVLGEAHYHQAMTSLQDPADSNTVMKWIANFLQINRNPAQ